jgi:SpoIID/LytB domain protein
MRRLLRLFLSVGLAVSVTPFVGPAAPAGAAECPDSGGADMPRAKAWGDVVFRGGGWGHGLGMSQYGAQGAAKLGCSYDQILRRYYAGTEVTSRPMPDRIRLRMLESGYRVDVRAVDGPLPWVLVGCVGPTPENPAAAPCPPVQPQGATWQLTLDPTGTQYVLRDTAVTGWPVVWQGGTAESVLRLEQRGAVARLTTWRGSSIYLDRWLRWDWTRFGIVGGAIDAVQYVEPSEVGSAMDKYLWGIAEVPASFPDEALKAQAVAARTYAAKRAGRVLLPTPADQNYTGWKKESEGDGGVWGARWKAAVDATSGQVIGLAGGGELIDAFYSSSMGGHTEDERYVWGVEAPWLRAVDDSRWDLASSNPAEKRSWAKGVSWGTLAGRLGFDEVSSISVPKRGKPSRVAGVKVTGIRGGALTTSYLEGWDVREALGLLSPGFTIRMNRLGRESSQPLAGDWDGDGRDEPGWFRKGSVALAMTSADGRAWTKRFRFGRAGDVAVVGDWDGDGDDDLGVFRAGTWLLRAGLTAGEPTTTISFGAAGDVPVVGSWNGRNVGIGVVRGNQWLLRRTLTSGKPHKKFRYGQAGDVPVVGSWTGRARDGIGVERDGAWLLRHKRKGGTANATFDFGGRRSRALAGDWDGDGRTSVGLVRGRTFRLRADVTDQARAPQQTFRG